MVESVMNIPSSKVEKIVNNPYYHLKNYGLLPTNNDASMYLGRFGNLEKKAKQKLLFIIEKQEEKERQKLAPLFSQNLSKDYFINAGFDSTSVNTLMVNYRIARSGDIEEKINFLNSLKTLTISSSEDTSVLGMAANIVGRCFSNGDIGPITELSSLQDYQDYIDALEGVYINLITELSHLNKESFLYNFLIVPTRKLKYAVGMAYKEYGKKFKERQNAKKKLNDFLAQAEKFLSIGEPKSWSMDSKRSSVQTVMTKSIGGLGRQLGGKAEEKFVLDYSQNIIKNIFGSSNITISPKGISGQVIGGKHNKFGVQQKADIELNFTIIRTSGGGLTEQLTFSVKKASSSSNIEIHHGGSLFSYARNLSAYDADFNFLNDDNSGAFQYIYVNELAKGRENLFVQSFKQLLNSFGFYFLGEEVKENDGGADFLVIQQKYYAFSTVLRKAMNSDIFQTTLKFTNNKKPLSEKNKYMAENPMKEYYSDEFIDKSISIGKSAIYGTTFSISLRKSALNP